MALANPRPSSQPRRSWSTWLGLRRPPAALPARDTAAESLGRLEAILGRPNFRVPGSRLVQASGDIIYCWQRDGQPVYIGMSSVGLLRPLSRAHDVVWALGEADSLLVWKMANAQEARNQERRAIRDVKPRFNLDMEARPVRPAEPEPLLEDAATPRAPVNLEFQW